MATAAINIANILINSAKENNKQLTNMQLQKLVYIVQGYSLAILDHPLYYNNTHAWQWGPVIPKLYKALQKYGKGFITSTISVDDKNITLSKQDNELIRAVWDAYKHYSGGQLSALTHKNDTPWQITWEKNRFGIIPLELISEHYKKRLVETF